MSIRGMFFGEEERPNVKPDEAAVCKTCGLYFRVDWYGAKHVMGDGSYCANHAPKYDGILTRYVNGKEEKYYYKNYVECNRDGFIVYNKNNP